MWVMGVSENEEDYALFSEITADKVKMIVCLGSSNGVLERELGGRVKSITEVDTIEEAIAHCAASAREGDVVLFSPACSGFDLFQNYKDRGQQFRKAVAKLRQ